MAQMKKSAAPMKKEIAPAKKKAEVKNNLIQDITNRFRVTAREARDIVTAVGTAIQEPNFKSDIAKQIKEVGPAATTGFKGTAPWAISKDKQRVEQKKRGSGNSTKSTGRGGSPF